jgi:hypothetical protein
MEKTEKKIKCSIFVKKGNMFQLGDNVSDWYTGGVGLDLYCDHDKEEITKTFDEIREHIKIELAKTEKFLRSVSLRSEVNNDKPEDISTNYSELIK